MPGHGNLAGPGEALLAAANAMATWRARHEQGMAHAALAFAMASKRRRRAMTMTTSIDPGRLVPGHQPMRTLSP